MLINLAYCTRTMREQTAMLLHASGRRILGEVLRRPGPSVTLSSGLNWSVIGSTQSVYPPTRTDWSGLELGEKEQLQMWALQGCGEWHDRDGASWQRGLLKSADLIDQNEIIFYHYLGPKITFWFELKLNEALKNEKGMKNHFGPCDELFFIFSILSWPLL